MITQAELSKLIDQINKSFDSQFQRVAVLEEKVAVLEEQMSKKEAPTKAKGGKDGS
jgi:hypothetical protein